MIIKKYYIINKIGDSFYISIRSKLNRPAHTYISKSWRAQTFKTPREAIRFLKNTVSNLIRFNHLDIPTLDCLFKNSIIVFVEK